MILTPMIQLEHAPELLRSGSLPTSSQWTMKDGTQVEIRPIRPQDEPFMVKFHSVLSDRTVYLRYFCSLSLATRTAHDRLVRICFSDPETETVLVATSRNPQTAEVIILA